MGNPSLPDEVKQRKGTLKPSRVIRNKAKIEPGIVPPHPEEMSEAEAQVWARLKAAVEYLGVYADSDLESFKFMVRSVAAAHLITEVEGVQFKDVIAARKQAMDLLASFGLNPQARSKISSLGQKTDDKDPLAEFLS